MKDLYVSWDEYNRLIEKLVVKVFDSGWEFDAIICLARGGLRVGDVFSRIFRKPLGVLFTSSYRDNAGTTRSHLVISEQLSSAQPLPPGRWLLVDDLADSGATLEQVIPELQQRYPLVTEMRSAVIWRKGTSVVKPDFELEVLPTNPWIHQPFEEYDQIRPEDLKSRWG
ncbi:MAG: phosphoribosyltransferase family protein [Burkholderiaceae bacterium]